MNPRAGDSKESNIKNVKGSVSFFQRFSTTRNVFTDLLR